MVDLHSGKKKGVRVACFNGDDRNVLCCFCLEAESRAIEASARRFFELEEEDQQRRQTFPWDAWKRTLIKAMERSSFDVKFCESQRSHPAWLLLLLRSPLFLDCWFVHSLHLDDSIVCPVPLRSRGRISKAKQGELDKIHALLLLLRPLLQSGSLRSVLETGAGSAALALSPFGQWCSATETGSCGGKLETCLTFQAFQSRSASSSRHSPTGWMEG